MTVNLNANQIWLYFLRLLSLAGVALAAVPADSIPPAIKPWFAIGGAIILAVDRYVADPSTGNTTTTTPAPFPPTPAAPAAGS
jgi:hypothetical protein